MRSSLFIVVLVLGLLVLGLVVALRGGDAEPAAPTTRADRAQGAGQSQPLATELSAQADLRTPVVPPPVNPTPSALAVTDAAASTLALPVRPVERPPEAPSDFVDSTDAALSDEDEVKQAEFLASKYTGWSREQKLVALAKIRQECRAIETAPGEIKTRANEYSLLLSELNWLKENQDP